MGITLFYLDEKQDVMSKGTKLSRRVLGDILTECGLTKAHEELSDTFGICQGSKEIVEALTTLSHKEDLREDMIQPIEDLIEAHQKFIDDGYEPSEIGGA
jgi:hypothetical protein